MNPQQQALLEQFRAYLEESEAGVAAEESGEGQMVDLFTLFSELSALKSEVKHESRQLKEALTQFGNLFEALQQNQQRLEQAQHELQQTARAAQTEGQQQILLEIVDLRERIQSSEQYLLGYRPGWLHRISSREQQFHHDLQQGIEITLRNLDLLLTHHGVTPIVTEGHAFDPHTMRVEAVAQRPELPDSTILETVHRGYRLNGKILRTARVIVNKLQDQHP